MSQKADEIIEKWQKHIPPTVPKREVEIVVTAFFPDTHYEKKATSHWIIIKDPDLHLAEKNGLITGVKNGTLPLSLVSGKDVKKYLVENLLEAVRIKKQFIEIRKNDTGEKRKR